jgi:phosphatidate phosphatase PAH1
MYFEIDFDLIDKTVTMYINETTSNQLIYMGSISNGTKYFWDTMDLPIDRELIVSFEPEDGEINIIASVFFTYVYD